MISQKTIEQIKRDARLVDIISDTVTLKQRGASFVGLCPFHGEKTPSFNVRDSDNFYHCFGCGVSGNPISYIMEREGFSFPDAVEYLGERFNIPIEREGKSTPKTPSVNKKTLYEITNKARNFFASELLKAPKEVINYLKERQITKEAIEHFSVGFAPLGWHKLKEHLLKSSFNEKDCLLSGLIKQNPPKESYDTFRSRLVFPVYVDSKRIAGFGGRVIPDLEDKNSTQAKYINSPETALYYKSSILYGLPQAVSAIKETKHVWLVEGYLDVIGLWQAGVKNVVATCGTAVTSQHIQKLGTVASRINLLLDGDKAGREAAAKCFPTFLNTGVDGTIVFLPEGEDPDTIAKTHQNNTGDYLNNLEKHKLFDVFLNSKVNKLGERNISDLGAAAKGKLAEEMLTYINKIENNFEREELKKLASFRLMISNKHLKQKDQPKKQTLLEDRIEKKSVDSNKEFNLVPVEQLPSSDRHFISLIMVEKEKLVEKVLQDSFLCSELHSSSIQFIQAMHYAISTTENQETKKEAIRGMLKSCGGSWINHWKEAYKMFDSGMVDTERMYEECLASYKKQRILRSIKQTDEDLKSAQDLDQRRELNFRKIELRKKLM